MCSETLCNTYLTRVSRDSVMLYALCAVRALCCTHSVTPYFANYLTGSGYRLKLLLSVILLACPFSHTRHVQCSAAFVLPDSQDLIVKDSLKEERHVILEDVQNAG